MALVGAPDELRKNVLKYKILNALNKQKNGLKYSELGEIVGKTGSLATKLKELVEQGFVKKMGEGYSLYEITSAGDQEFHINEGELRAHRITFEKGSTAGSIFPAASGTLSEEQKEKLRQAAERTVTSFGKDVKEITGNENFSIAAKHGKLTYIKL